jgi:hypothetical protein
MKTLFCAVLAAAFIPLAASAQQQGEEPPPHHGHHHPSPEAIGACQGKQAGDACSFTHKDRSLEGACFTPASDKPLACRPARPPPQAK